MNIMVKILIKLIEETPAINSTRSRDDWKDLARGGSPVGW